MRDVPDSIGTIARQSAAAADDAELHSSAFHIADADVDDEYRPPCTDCPSSLPFATADCIAVTAAESLCGPRSATQQVLASECSRRKQQRRVSCIDVSSVSRARIKQFIYIVNTYTDVEKVSAAEQN